jgi:hypothetical protein
MSSVAARYRPSVNPVSRFTSGSDSRVDNRFASRSVQVMHSWSSARLGIYAKQDLAPWMFMQPDRRMFRHVPVPRNSHHVQPRHPHTPLSIRSDRNHILGILNKNKFGFVPN